MSEWYQTVAFTPAERNANSPLPDLALVALDNWSLTQVSGDDTQSYLQGQLTCDLSQLEKNQSTLAAHCDPKGKVWSVLRLFHHGDGLAMVQPMSIAQTQLTEIKKYAIFSKIDFQPSQDVLLGVVGQQAEQVIAEHFGAQGAVRHSEHGTAVMLEPTRWLLAISPAAADQLVAAYQESALLADHTLWEQCDVDAALPRIEDATKSEFIPQSLNLQVLNAISFTKGCYTGQETVARAKYRGINKRAMYKLVGQADQAPKPGDKVERAVGDNWRAGGTVITGAAYSDGRATALVVLPNNLDDDTAFRFADAPDAIWQRVALPYSLEEEK
ncbi:tRNA-modifying protein YgfZ [Salinivibrio proteolyticus]|uniref:tRNA-modifying protein YgfZ n=1 Tax=Salinivibrio proteolyticus TaxID=334715 RepID=UPI0009893E09|nr:tRNA-modifying protein YgfZ [Salinivibrio proteolyticus]OOF31412.1 tRNA-modifying protein YgfZ [Salinivibrio proteolyticus]